MKVYKIELMVIDFENVGQEGISRLIEDCKYVNPKILSCNSRIIKGEWSDDHPLNKIDTFKQELERIFK